MGSVNLRWATAGDTDDVLDLLQAYHRQEGFGRASTPRLRALLEDLFESPSRGKIVLATVDDEAVGYALLVRRYSFEFASQLALLDEIFVKGKARERGLGRRMITFCEEYAASEGLPAIILEVPVRNVAAREFYRSVGFQRIDREIYMRQIRTPR